MIADERRVIAYDLRGHGRSPWSGPHTLAQHTLDLDEVLEAIGAGQVALVGDGFGCRVALEYAAAHGERVTALALLDPPLRPGRDQVLALAAAERRGRVFASADAAIASGRATPAGTTRPARWSRRTWPSTSSSTRTAACGSATATTPPRRRSRRLAEPVEGLKEVVCPVLLVRGEASDLLSAADAGWAAAGLRRCRLEVVPGGHVPLWDALAETGALVRTSSPLSGRRRRRSRRRAR